MTQTETPEAPRPQGGGPRPSPMTMLMIGIVGTFALLILFYGFSNTFNLLIINPLINLLVLLDYIVLGNFGMAIILFTALLRLATTPLTMNTFKSQKNMQAAQPVIAEIQKKYKDPQKQRQEMAKVYKEYGINPLGCALPFVIQIIFFGALYRALVYMVGGSPESLVGLSQRLYDIPFLQDSIPLNQQFLWMDLGQPDQTLILPITGIRDHIRAAEDEHAGQPNASASSTAGDDDVDDAFDHHYVHAETANGSRPVLGGFEHHQPLYGLLRAGQDTELAELAAVPTPGARTKAGEEPGRHDTAAGGDSNSAA